MTQSLEGWPTKAKEAPSPHETGYTYIWNHQNAVPEQESSQRVSVIFINYF